MLGGFTGATVRATAMTKNACMESSVFQMALRKLSIHTGINSSQIVASADTDSCLLKNVDFGRHCLVFFQCEGNYPLQASQNMWTNNEKWSLRC